jgi:hypothetical protein
MLQEKDDGVVEALDLKVEEKRTVLRDLGGGEVCDEGPGWFPGCRED